MKIEVSAKSIEKAIEEGLKKLNTTIENVTVNVITEGGLFKKAKIEMIMDDDKDIKDEIFDLEENTNSMNAEIKDDDPSNDELVSTPVSAELETEVVYDKDKVVEVKEKLTLNDIVKETENIKDTESQEQKQQRKQEMLNQTMTMAKQWLDGLMYAYNINAVVEVSIRENDVYANIVGENLGVLIGYHGEAMEAIQHLVNTYLYSKLKGAKRVFVDVSGYREKRNNDLRSLANKIASKVLENKRSYRLDPMNSFERRIIHEELSKTPHILTHSEGVDPNRYLIIEYTEEK